MLAQHCFDEPSWCWPTHGCARIESQLNAIDMIEARCYPNSHQSAWINKLIDGHAHERRGTNSRGYAK